MMKKTNQNNISITEEVFKMQGKHARIIKYTPRYGGGAIFDCPAPANVGVYGMYVVCVLLILNM